MLLFNTFYFDPLSLCLILLISFIALIVVRFAFNYLQGDNSYSRFFILLGFLVLAVIGMVSTNHLGVLLISSWASNFLLVKLMIHKSSWAAAKASGRLAAKNFMLSGLFLSFSFLSFYSAAETVSIHSLNTYAQEDNLIYLGLLFLVFAAMAQSGIWPFHRWLISSLNSPTPVSAFMHAGLVNGGGFLLIRFAPLLLKYPYILDVIFCVGMITAVVGTGWKLLQQDIKRMLACSTMGQMGFMFVQCGLGLFPAALVHLYCHSLFKAYLFLASGSAAQERRLDLKVSPCKKTFCLAFLCGILASFLFSLASHKAWIPHDTTLFVNVLIFIVSCQIALSILDNHSVTKLFMALGTTSIAGITYGYANYACEGFFSDFLVLTSHPLNAFHWIGIILLIACWLSVLFVRQEKVKDYLPMWALKFYVKALNQSQPHPTTITTHRLDYKYL